MRKFTITITWILFVSFFTSVSWANTYTAFSFKNARKQIESNRNNSDAFNFAGITRSVALVYDTDNEDIILVGKKEANQRPIHHDDRVVAIRAILKNRQDPGVSIARTKETDITKIVRRCNDSINMKGREQRGVFMEKYYLRR